MEKDKIEWIPVNLEGLITAVSETAWASEVKAISSDNLYTTHVEDGGETKKVVKDEWASTFWQLHHAYSELASSYIKPIEDAVTEKRDQDQGSVGAGTEGQDTEVRTGD